MLNLAVCVPLHLWVLPRGPSTTPHVASAPGVPAGSRPAPPAVFRLARDRLALASFMSSALSAHVIGLLTSSGLTARDAVLVASLIGPMQVAGRVAEFTFGRRLRPLTVGTLAFGLFALAFLVLTQVHGIWIAALAFAALYGWSNGVMTIVRGTVPASCSGTVASARCSAASRGRNSSPRPSRRSR